MKGRERPLLVRKQNFSTTRDLRMNFRCRRLRKSKFLAGNFPTRISSRVFAEDSGSHCLGQSWTLCLIELPLKIGTGILRYSRHRINGELPNFPFHVLSEIQFLNCVSTGFSSRFVRFEEGKKQSTEGRSFKVSVGGDDSRSKLELYVNKFRIYALWSFVNWNISLEHLKLDS